jgi:hypothetical protein
MDRRQLTGLGIIVGLWALAVAPAQAQPPAPRSYVLAGAGAGSLADDEGGLGSGPAFGGAIGWRLSDAVSLEGAVSRLRHERPGSLAWRGTPVVAVARVLRMWGARPSRTRAFAGGGVGYIHYTGTRTDTIVDARGASRLVDEGWRVQGLAVEGGGGIWLHVTGRIVIRPEAWLTLARPRRRGVAPEPPYFMPRAMVSAGISF